MTTTQTQTLEVGDLTVGYIDEGAGAPLVLVHGGESDRTQFRELRPYLAGVRAISYDQRDSGVTTGSTAPYEMADLADDLAAFVEALGLTEVHVLGTSFGGALAQHFALRHPDKLRSLILVCTTPSARMIPPELMSAILELAAVERREAMVDHLFTPAGRANDPGLVTRNWTTLASRPEDADARRHAAARAHHTVDDLDHIQAPTLVIHGDDDKVAPVDHARILADRIPGARLEFIKGGRHGIATEFPDTVSRLALGFIAEHATENAVRG